MKLPRGVMGQCGVVVVDRRRSQACRTCEGGGGILELGAESEREEEGKLMQDSSRCWGACELAVRGAALLGPRRRRGGSRAKLRRGRGEGRELQRDGKGRWGVSGRRVEATRSRRWHGEGGPERRAGGARHRRRERAERDRQGKGKMDPFAISKISRDLNVKQG